MINKDELHQAFNDLKENKSIDNLYKKYNTLIYSISFSILKNKENSEDVTQIVFTKIWNMDKNNLPITNEASWLYSLTKNETLNYIRKQKSEINIDDIYYISNENNEIDKIIDVDSYNRIISKLNKKEQEIVSLKIISQLSFKEISKILDIPIGTVQWIYYKSLHTLKILLSNLSMFILTILSFTIYKSNDKKEVLSETQKENVEDKEASGTHRVEIESDTLLEDVEKLESAKNEIDNTINETVENTVVQEENLSFTNLDIGILSLAGIFLTITIIFSIIYTKHQQKAKKKVSK